MTGRSQDVGWSEAAASTSSLADLPEATITEIAAVEENQLTLDLVVDLTNEEPKLEIWQTRPIKHRQQSAPRWQLATKRAMDVVGASLMLVFLLPLMLLTALAVAVSSRGPVLFTQERVGYMGRRFRFLKFRSMYHDAAGRREEIEYLNHHESGPIFKIRDDPRITRVGKVIRRMSIDELPQLIHVVAGNMSLVGPRPALPNEVETYDSYQLERLTAKPGIICIWQVSGRSDLGFDTWVNMDIEYIETWSLWLDIKLLVRAVPAVISRRGAY